MSADLVAAKTRGYEPPPAIDSEVLCLYIGDTLPTGVSEHIGALLSCFQSRSERRGLELSEALECFRPPYRLVTS